jgi:hypothetical protein
MENRLNNNVLKMCAVVLCFGSFADAQPYKLPTKPEEITFADAGKVAGLKVTAKGASQLQNDALTQRTVESSKASESWLSLVPNLNPLTALAFFAGVFAAVFVTKFLLSAPSQD